MRVADTDGFTKVDSCQGSQVDQSSGEAEALPEDNQVSRWGIQEGPRAALRFTELSAVRDSASRDQPGKGLKGAWQGSRFRQPGAR